MRSRVAKMSYQRFGVAIVAILSSLSISACGLSEWEYEETNRVSSPDQAVDVVTIRGNGGATTGFVYRMFIVPRGLKFDKDATSFERQRAIFSGDHFEDFKIEWREPKLLEIQFRQARIFGFRNYWSYWNPASPDENHNYVVEVKLAPLTEGSALSEEDRGVN